MFSSGSLSSISFATETPSLVIVGDPNFLSRMTLRPFGPRVTLTALARLLTPRRMPWRDESPYTICFAMMNLLRLAFSGPRQAELLLILRFRRPRGLPASRLCAGSRSRPAIELDFLARIFAKRDVIARLHIERDTLAIGVER